MITKFFPCVLSWRKVLIAWYSDGLRSLSRSPCSSTRYVRERREFGWAVSDHLKIRLLECRILEVFATSVLIGVLVTFVYSLTLWHNTKYFCSFNLATLSNQPYSSLWVPSLQKLRSICVWLLYHVRQTTVVMNETTPGTELCSSPTMYRKGWWFVRTR